MTSSLLQVPATELLHLLIMAGETYIETYPLPRTAYEMLNQAFSLQTAFAVRYQLSAWAGPCFFHCRMTFPDHLVEIHQYLLEDCSATPLGCASWLV